MGVSEYSAGKELPSARKMLSSPAAADLAAGGAAQGASSLHCAVGGRGAVQQIVDRLAGERDGRGAQQAGGGGIGKADLAVAVDAADAVGDRVEQDLLLAVELFGPAAFLGAGQHLAQRGGGGLDGGHGFAVFAEPEVAVKLEDGQDVVADAHRHGPAGDHLLAQRGLNAGAGGTRSSGRRSRRRGPLSRRVPAVPRRRPACGPCSPG